MNKIAKEITEKICECSTYGEAIKMIRDNYNRDQKIKDDGYSIEDLLDGLKEYRVTGGKIWPNYITRDGDLRWAVMTLELTNLIRNAQDLETAANIIEERYVKNTRSNVEIVSSVDNYTAEQLVRSLRDIVENDYPYQTITSNCNMRKAVKETHNR